MSTHVLKLAAQIAAHESWANTTDRTARTAPARAALDAKFLAEAGGDPVRAEHVRKAYYRRLALKSAESRRRNRAAREARTNQGAVPQRQPGRCDQYEWCTVDHAASGPVHRVGARS